MPHSFPPANFDGADLSGAVFSSHHKRDLPHEHRSKVTFLEPVASSVESSSWGLSGVLAPLDSFRSFLNKLFQNPSTSKADPQKAPALQVEHPVDDATTTKARLYTPQTPTTETVSHQPSR